MIIVRCRDDDGINQSALQHVARVAEQRHGITHQLADSRMLSGVVVADGSQAGVIHGSSQKIPGVDGTDVAHANNAKTYFFMSCLTQDQ